MPSDIGLPTYESLLQSALDALPEGEDKSENSFYWQHASAAAILGNELMIGVKFLLDSMYVANKTGSDLDTFISDRTSLVRQQATRAEGTVTFTGNVGAYIEQGTRVAAGDQQFVTLWGDTVKENGTVEIDIQAVNIGNIGYIAAGAVNKIVTSTVGISGVTNGDALINGRDEETDDNLRARYNWHLQHFPYNLNESTIKEWAYDVAGVGQARPKGDTTNNQIIVYLLDTNYEPAGEGLIAEVQAALSNHLAYGFTLLATAPAKEYVNITVTIAKADETLSTTIKTALEKAIKTYPDPSYIRTDLSLWEIINAIETVANMDNIVDIAIDGVSGAVYTLSATDGSKLLAIGNVTVVEAS